MAPFFCHQGPFAPTLAVDVAVGTVKPPFNWFDLYVHNGVGSCHADNQLPTAAKRWKRTFMLYSWRPANNLASKDGCYGLPVVNQRVELRLLTEGDLDLLVDWLRSHHVARWWHPESRAHYAEKYRSRLSGATPVDVFIIFCADVPVGMLQAAYDERPDAPYDCGLDILIGDEAALRQGIASGAIRHFVDHPELHRSEIRVLAADPDEDNIASIATFERAGFVATELPEGLRWVRTR